MYSDTGSLENRNRMWHLNFLNKTSQIILRTFFHVFDVPDDKFSNKLI